MVRVWLGEVNLGVEGEKGFAERGLLGRCRTRGVVIPGYGKAPWPTSPRLPRTTAPGSPVWPSVVISLQFTPLVHGARTRSRTKVREQRKHRILLDLVEIIGYKDRKSVLYTIPVTSAGAMVSRGACHPISSRCRVGPGLPQGFASGEPHVRNSVSSRSGQGGAVPVARPQAETATASS